MDSLAVSGQEWPTPNLDFVSGDAEVSAPNFPIDVLGPFWSSFIADAAGEMLPRDFFAVALLGTTAGLIGNALEAQMPSPSTLKQPATLWLVNVGHPGAGKTPAFEPFLKIVSEIEQDRREDGVRIKIEDATIAGAIHALLNNQRGIVVMDDELSGWWDSFKLDRQGEQFWLKAWNGNAPYTITRGGRPPMSYEIPRHNLSVVGGAQPATLSTMLDATSGVERGFVSRCMFAFPDAPKDQPATGRRPNLAEAGRILRKIYDLPLSDGGPTSIAVTADAHRYHEEWHKRLKREGWIIATNPEGQWLAKQYGTSLRLALVLETLWWASAAKADAKVFERAHKIAAMANQAANPNGHQRLVAQTKLAELCAQYGLNIEDIVAGRTPSLSMRPPSVSKRAMEAACSLVLDYFHPHFLRCQDYAYSPIHETAAVELTRALVVKGMTTFNSRELRQYQYGKIHAALHGNRASATVNDVCNFLEARKIIRRIVTASAGRKPLDYEVNPLTAMIAKQARQRR